MLGIQMLILQLFFVSFYLQVLTEMSLLAFYKFLLSC